MKNDFPIGIFDSGYGGLTVLSEIRKSLPNYDFIYLETMQERHMEIGLSI